MRQQAVTERRSLGRLALQAAALMTAVLASLLLWRASAIAQTQQAWPDNPKLSGNAFLPPGLRKLQDESATSPIALWLDRGRALWADASSGASCQSCHTGVESLKNSAPTFPRLRGNGVQLVNLEDQIVTCSARSGRAQARLEDDDILALSALLHEAAKGMPIDVRAAYGQAVQWQARLQSGTTLFSRRIGRLNLACVHCHEENVGRQMRTDVVSPGHPTGFPVYRMGWQKIGSIDRRLRACYSGVQAVLPPPGAAELRELELYLKVRANGMPIDGPSIRR
jgi:L-cysteine S-thiosulfotransferase